MGDRTYLRLNVWDGKAPIHDPSIIIHRLQQLYPDFSVLEDDGNTYDECSLEYEKPLIQFSKDNPTMLFCMCVESTSGVGIESVWNHYYKNGKSCRIDPIWPEFNESMLS